MSWQLYATSRKANVAADLDAAAPSPDSTAPEQVAQVNAAKEAAKGLVDAVVRDGRDVSVTLAGHAEVADGTGQQTITVSLMESYPVGTADN